MQADVMMLTTDDYQFTFTRPLRSELWFWRHMSKLNYVSSAFWCSLIITYNKAKK